MFGAAGTGARDQQGNGMQDRRGQTIQPGVYTLRYGVMPANDDHQGAAPHRDFALLIPAADDRDLSAVPKPDALAAMIRRAAQGDSVIADSMTQRLIAQMRMPARVEDVPVPVVARDTRDAPALTPREHDIVRIISRGASNKDIARELDLAESTVKIHVRNVLRKLSLSSRMQIAIYALKRRE